MNTPDFIFPGTARAGTTSLYYYLKQHPQIFLPVVKEPCFFCFPDKIPDYKNGKFSFAVTDENKYSELFDKAKKNQLKGDISTPYLYLYDKTIKKIQHYIPGYRDVKIIIILRNPVERAYSQYLWRVRDGRENLAFEEALECESKRKKENYSFDYFYSDRSFYFNSVNAYLKTFKNVKIILFENLKFSLDDTLRDICEFLNIDSEFSFRHEEPSNESWIPKNSLLNKIITTESKVKFRLLNKLPDEWKQNIKRGLQKINSKKEVPLLKEKTYEKLIDRFRNDISKLQELIGTDLSSWLKKEKE